MTDAIVRVEAGIGFEVIAWRHPKAMGAHGRCIGQTDLRIDPRKAKRLAHRIRREARRQGWPCVIHTSPLRRCAAVGRQLRRWGWRHHIDVSLMEMDFGAWDGLPWDAVPRNDIDAWCADFLDGRPGGGESLRMMFERVARGLERLVREGQGVAREVFGLACETKSLGHEAKSLVREEKSLAHEEKNLEREAESLTHKEKSLARQADILAHEEIDVAAQARMLAGGVKGFLSEAASGVGEAPRLVHEAPMLVVAHAGWMTVADWLARQAPLPVDAAQWSAPTPAHGVCWRFKFKI